MIIRPFNKTDLVWLRPTAEKYGSWDDCQALAKDPDAYGLVCAFVIAPYTVGCLIVDAHGTILEGLCDDFGIKQFMKLGRFLCELADDTGIDLHNHKGQKAWERSALRRLGFTETVPEIGWARYAYKQADQEVA